jgi:uncharacterized protein
MMGLSPDDRFLDFQMVVAPALVTSVQIILGGGVAYALALIFLACFQRRLVFQRIPITPGDPRALDGLDCRRIRLATADGEELDALWTRPKAAPVATILYLHGNASDLRTKAPRIRRLTELGFSVLAFDWRGYGRSTGSPSQEGLGLDADAALNWLERHAELSRAVVLGESIGSGVAVELAAKRKVGALVLEAPYVSIVDIAQARLPIFPVRRLLLDPFRSDLWIGKIGTRLLIQHGVLDRTIPFRHGERLFAMAPEPKRLIAYPRGGHDDLPEKHDSYRDLAAFVVESLALPGE